MKAIWGRYQAPLILAGYALLALLWLRAPLMYLSTHLTGDIGVGVTTDYYHFHWNYWWIRHALSLGLDVYQTQYVFAPATSNLSMHTLTPFWYPVWAALEPIFDTGAAMTGVFFVALVLNGWVFHRFLAYMGASPSLALVGGVLLQGSAVMFESLKWTMVNLMGWFWLPLALWVWLLLSQDVQTQRGGWRWAIPLGLTLWAMILTDLQYAVFLALLMVPLGLWTLARNRRRAALVGWGLAALSLALALLWWVGPLSALLAFDRSSLATTPVERATAIPFPEGLITRTTQGVSLGWLVLPILAIGVFGWLRGQSHQTGMLRPPAWLWLMCAFGALMLALGPDIMVFGRDVPLPYTALHALLGGNFRYPERFVNVFLIAGLTFALPIVSQTVVKAVWARRVPVLLMALALLDVRILESVPLQARPTPYAFYEAMGAEGEQYVVLEVPTAGASGEGLVGRPEWAAAQFYGVTHGKQMVNGHLSRVDPWRYLYMETSDPMLSWLGQRRYIEPGVVWAQLAERIYAWPIGYLVVHRDWIPADGPTQTEIFGYLNAQHALLCPVWVEGAAVVYRTRWHPAGCPPRRPPETAPGVYTVDLGAEDDVRYIGWGWYYPEPVGGINWRWAGDYARIGGGQIPEGGALHADVYVDLPPGAYRLTLDAQSFAEDRDIFVSVNGEYVGDATLDPFGLQSVSFDLSESVVGSGQHLRVRIEYPWAVVPAEVGQGSDDRRLAIAVDQLRFTALDERSAQP